MRVCWAVQGEEAPGHGFFACLSVWFGCMIPGLYEVIQYTNSLFRRAAGADPSRPCQILRTSAVVVPGIA